VTFRHARAGVADFPLENHFVSRQLDRVSRLPNRCCPPCVRRGRGLGAACVAGLILLAACARTPPYQQVIEAVSTAQFDLWRADHLGVLMPEDRSWFNVAIQEFKFQVMLSGKATGSEAVDAAMREKINGRKLIDVMREGLQAYLKRKTADKDDLERAILINSKLHIPPGDEEKAKELAEFQENLRNRLARLKEEVAAAETAIARVEAQAQ
jgi:hypothetical protein